MDLSFVKDMAKGFILNADNPELAIKYLKKLSENGMVMPGDLKDNAHRIRELNASAKEASLVSDNWQIYPQITGKLKEFLADKEGLKEILAEANMPHHVEQGSEQNELRTRQIHTKVNKFLDKFEKYFTDDACQFVAVLAIKGQIDKFDLNNNWNAVSPKFAKRNITLNLGYSSLAGFGGGMKDEAINLGLIDKDGKAKEGVQEALQQYILKGRAPEELQRKLREKYDEVKEHMEGRKAVLSRW